MTPDKISILYLIGIPIAYAIFYGLRPEWKENENGSNALVPMSFAWPITVTAMLGFKFACAAINFIEKSVDKLLRRDSSNPDK